MRRFISISKWVAGVGFLVLLVCGGGASFLVPMIQRQLAAQQARAQGAAVVVETAAKGELIRTVSAPGSVSCKIGANITSRVSAKILKLPYDEGATVSEGDILVELDSKELEAALAGAEARYAADLASLKSSEASLLSEDARILGSKASHLNSVAEWERQQELFKSGDVSQSALDSARTEMDRSKSVYDAAVAGLESVRANIEAARARSLASKAEVERAQRNVEYATIRAPFNGVIVRRQANVGEVALGTIQNMGGTLMVLEDHSEIIVNARLAEMDAPRVSLGQKVRAYINGFPDEVFAGTLRKIGLTTQKWTDQTTFFLAEVLIETHGRSLSTGTTSNVDIEIQTLGDVLIVPAQAVLDKRVDELPQKLREANPLVDREKTFARVVFVMEGGKAMMTPVKTLATNLTKAAVAQGLSEGSIVIVGPYKALQEMADGAPVRIAGEDKNGPNAKGEPRPAVAEKEPKAEKAPAPSRPGASRAANSG